jgi:predicted RNA-binding protein YlqC (UPF0109 family)
MSREMLEYVAGWLVDNPDDVEITEVEGERGQTVYELTVHPDDMGKVIGRQGRIIRALRALVRASGQMNGQSATVEVVD